MQDILLTVSRSERRSILANADRARKSGVWGDWEKLTFPRFTIGRGWSGEITTAYRNRVFSVLGLITGTPAPDTVEAQEAILKNLGAPT